MSTESLIQAIDTEIVRLQKVRAILSGVPTVAVKKRRGRPTTSPNSGTKKRTMSPEARAKIAAAQKRRWAAARKAAK